MNKSVSSVTSVESVRFNWQTNSELQSKVFQTGKMTIFFLLSIEMLVKIANFFEVSTDYLLGLDKKRTLDVENLTEIQISHIQLIVDDLRNAK